MQQQIRHESGGLTEIANLKGNLRHGLTLYHYPDGAISELHYYRNGGMDMAATRHINLYLQLFRFRDNLHILLSGRKNGDKQQQSRRQLDYLERTLGHRYDNMKIGL